MKPGVATGIWAFRTSLFNVKIFTVLAKKTLQFWWKISVSNVCLHSLRLRHICVSPHFYRFDDNEEVFRKTESHLKAKKANRIVYRIKFHVTFYESSSSSISTKIPKHHSSLFVTLLRFNSTQLGARTDHFPRHNDSTTKLEEKEKRPSKGNSNNRNINNSFLSVAQRLWQQQ